MPASPHQFTCARCGGPLSFSPEAAALACGRCGYVHQAEHRSGSIAEHDYYAALRQDKDHEPQVVRSITGCGACGAQFELPADVHAGRCPYCDSPLVLDPAAQRSIPVHAVLPFAVPAAAARTAFKRWLEGLWFAPSRLVQFARQDRDLAGTYVPHWTYDSTTHTRYVGERGDAYLVPVREQMRVGGQWVERTRMETRVRWTPAAGSVDRAFDDVLVLASDAVPATLVERAGPWPLVGLAEYDPEYLSGFTSALYSLDVEAGFARARAKMSAMIRSSVRTDIGGDLQRIHELSTDHRDVRYKHVLLPLWLAAFRFRGKVYRFVVNGVTGEVQGERPYSAWKIALAAVAVAAVVAAVAYFTGSPGR